jgi:hypothetical protein
MWKLLVMSEIYAQCVPVLGIIKGLKVFPDWVDNELYTCLCNWLLLLLLFMLCCCCLRRRRHIPSLCDKSSIPGAAGSTVETDFLE